MINLLCRASTRILHVGDSTVKYRAKNLGQKTQVDVDNIFGEISGVGGRSG